MWEAIKRLLRSANYAFKKRRFRNLAPDLQYQQIVFKNEEGYLARRKFLYHIASGILTLLGVISMSKIAKAERFQRWVKQVGAHTNTQSNTPTPHSNHGNAPHSNHGNAPTPHSNHSNAP